MPAVNVRWTADRTGPAHAVVGRSFRAVCGEVATDERFAWPTRERCLACQAVVDPDASLPEAVLFAGYGLTPEGRPID